MDRGRKRVGLLLEWLGVGRGVVSRGSQGMWSFFVARGRARKIIGWVNPIQPGVAKTSLRHKGGEVVNLLCLLRIAALQLV